MTTRRLEPDQWKPYFDRVSQHLPVTEVELHVDAPDLGDQIVFQSAELVGIDYDTNDQAFEVAIPGTSHRIASPRSVSVEESPQALHAVEVTDGDGRQHILTLRRALALPAG